MFEQHYCPQYKLCLDIILNIIVGLAIEISCLAFKSNLSDFCKLLQFPMLLDMMAQMLARRAEDREVPGSSPTRD